MLRMASRLDQHSILMILTHVLPLLELLHTCHQNEFEMRAILILLIYGALVLLSLSAALKNFHTQLMKDRLISCCSISRPSFLGYLLSEAPSLASRHTNIQVASSDVQRRDKNQLQCGIYGVNDISNSIVYPEPNLGGYQLEQQ